MGHITLNHPYWIHQARDAIAAIHTVRVAWLLTSVLHTDGWNGRQQQHINDHYGFCPSLERNWPTPLDNTLCLLLQGMHSVVMTSVCDLCTEYSCPFPPPDWLQLRHYYDNMPTFRTSLYSMQRCQSFVGLHNACIDRIQSTPHVISDEFQLLWERPTNTTALTSLHCMSWFGLLLLFELISNSYPNALGTSVIDYQLVSFLLQPQKKKKSNCTCN